MTESLDNLRIENPCPFALTKMNKCGDNYYCKSCSKTIIDFRGKPVEDLKFLIDKDTCGIFSVDQLPGQQPMKWPRQFLLCGLTFLSFLGFSVKPLSAQTITPKDSVSINRKSPTKIESKRDKPMVKDTCNTTEKQGLLRRKKKQKLIGCPAF